MSLNDPQVQFKRIKDSKHVEAYSVIGYYNKKVRNIVIPDKYRGLPVISISAGAFKDYKYLKNVILPDTIVSILDDAFKNCSSLFNIHLSSSLSFIGAMAFINWDFGKLSNAKYETNTYDINQSFENLSVDGETDAISFVLSEDKKCRVVCHELENMKHG